MFFHTNFNGQCVGIHLKIKLYEPSLSFTLACKKHHAFQTFFNYFFLCKTLTPETLFLACLKYMSRDYPNLIFLKILNAMQKHHCKSRVVCSAFNNAL